MAKLRVLIVGGGIAGLATAIALRGPNRRITILERSSMLREIGALISLQPNATKIVAQWPIESFLAAAEPMADRALRMFDVDGNLIREMKLYPEKFGAERMLFHRQDLHRALRDAAISPDLPGPPVKIRTSCPVRSCDPEAGTVTLESGETFEADLTVGADGIHSVVRTAVLDGEERTAIPTGISAYRMLVPSSELDDVSVGKELFDPRVPVTTMIMGHAQRVIMGPARGGKIFGIVALVPDEKMQEASSAASWVEPGSLEKLLASFSAFPDWLKAVFTKAAQHGIALWQLRDLDPLPTWVRGRAIVIGDASHAMLPTQGQGASQAIEDAEALREFLSDADRERVGEALERVMRVRFDRASLIQAYSRQQAKPGTDAKSNMVKLDPGQFMKYNCDYTGALDWEKKVDAYSQRTQDESDSSAW